MIGTTTAFLYSLYNTFTITGEMFTAHTTSILNRQRWWSHWCYLESIWRRTAKNSAKQAINSLVSMIPNTAILLKDGQEVEIPAKMCG